MATKTVTKDLNVDSSDAQITGWVNNDTLVINNGATVTVNTNQTKFWNTITINNGKLKITNTSTTSSITKSTGQSISVAPALERNFSNS